MGIIPLLADGARRVTIQTSVGPAPPLAARLRTPGVYPVEIRLLDRTGTVTTVRTPLIRLGTDEEPLPVPDLDLIVGVAVEPTVEPEGRRPLTDDELDRLTRLARLLDTRPAAMIDGGDAPTLHVTLAPRPDTLDALAASVDPRAAAVLDSVRAAGGRGRVLGPAHCSAVGFGARRRRSRRRSSPPCSRPAARRSTTGSAPRSTRRSGTGATGSTARPPGAGRFDVEHVLLDAVAGCRLGRRPSEPWSMPGR